MRASLTALVSWIVLGGCHASPSSTPPLATPTPSVTTTATDAASGADMPGSSAGAPSPTGVPSPTGAAPSPTGAVPPAVLAGEPIVVDPLPHYRYQQALCADYVARSAGALKETGGWAHLHPMSPSCREAKLPVPFRGDATFRGAHAFALGSGLDSMIRLAVALPRGLAMTPISWGYQNIHASDAEPLPGTLESLSVEGGALIAVVGRTEGTRGLSGAPERVLVRGAIVCRALSASDPLSCRAYQPDARAPIFGVKRQPWEAATPWEKLSWDKAPSFTFTPERGLVVGN